jgi:predicted dithiol-disulfide oxidoreductase (DUF899 family)
LLTKEKELTRHRDELNAERRKLPMVECEKEYLFSGSSGTVRLLDLFDGRRQLIIYHFMFDPSWDEGWGGTEDLHGLGDGWVRHHDRYEREP